MMPTVSEELTERSHTLTAALYKGSLSAVVASLPPLAEALAPAAAEHWGLVKTLGRNIGHTMEELTDMGFALDALDKLVASKSKEIRAAACWALAEIGAERPDNISGLAYRLAKDEAWEVRDQIAAAYDERIGPAQPRSLFELMRRWSNDSDERVRRTPALSLIRRARRDRVPVLAILEVLRRDSSIYVRKGVVYCLQQAWGRAENPNYGPLTPDSPAFLLRILRDWAKDPSPNTRWVVAYTLAHTWVAPYLPDALAIMRIVARDPNEWVQKAVTAALLGLRKLGSPLLRRTMEAWAAESYEPTVSQLARRVLAEMPAEAESAALSPTALPVAPPASRSRDGRAHAEGRAGNDARGPNHRPRRHQPGRPPAAPYQQHNGNAPAPTTARAETSIAPPAAALIPPNAEAADQPKQHTNSALNAQNVPENGEQRNAPTNNGTTFQTLSQHSTLETDQVAPHASLDEAAIRPRKPRANSKLRVEAISPDENSESAAAPAGDAASVEQPTAPTAPKKRTSKAKPEAALDAEAAAVVEASVAQPSTPKKRTSKTKPEAQPEASAVEATPQQKKPRANSKLKTQNSKLEEGGSNNG